MKRRTSFSNFITMAKFHVSQILKILHGEVSSVFILSWIIGYVNYLLSSKLNEQPFKRIPASSMLVLPSTSFMALASSFAARDSGTTGTIATTAAAAGDFAAAATDMPVHSSILSALESAPTTLSSIRSCLDTRVTPQDLPASSDTLDDAWVFFSAPVARLFELLAAAQNHAFEPLFGHPWVLLSTTALMTVSDRVPFVPC